MIRDKVLTICMVMGSAAAVLAQRPDFSGTWRLEPGLSDISAEAVFNGLIGVGVPETLHVTGPANGTLVVESRVNESHARIYAPGGTRTTPVFLGEAGTITVSSRWEGASLVSRGEREAPSEATASQVTESFRLSGNGSVLEVVITTKNAAGTYTSEAAYRRIHEVEPCESWPTPCKTP